MNIQLDYVPADGLAGQDASWWRTVLGVVGFDRPPSVNGARVPVATSMTRPLGAAPPLCEVWRLADGLSVAPAIRLLERGRVRYSHCAELLFGCVTIKEEGAAGDGSNALRQATMAAYQDIFEVLEDTRHPHLIRVWNYLPEINREADGEERYRHFNAARQDAFHNAGRTTVGTVPAACALGSLPGSPICIYFLASRRTPTMIENPRQTSAYFYPPEFGSHSPTFSRACLLNGSTGTNLFVSGTASIVGHETLHCGDASAQTRETLTNIDALLDEANRIVASGRYLLKNLKFKVYIRRAADFAAIESVLSGALDPSTSIVYLQADVCREDLLVEIEAAGDSMT